MSKATPANKAQTAQLTKHNVIRLLVGTLVGGVILGLGVAYLPLLHDAFWPSAGLSHVADQLSQPAPGCSLTSRSYSGYSGAPDSAPTIQLSFKCDTSYDDLNNFITAKMNAGGCVNEVSIGYAGPPPTVGIAAGCAQGYGNHYIGIGITPANTKDPALQDLASTAAIPNVQVSGYVIDIQ